MRVPQPACTAGELTCHSIAVSSHWTDKDTHGFQSRQDSAVRSANVTDSLPHTTSSEMSGLINVHSDECPF